ncbi:MAG: amidohydrolase family protein [Pseudolabrys sp.]|nr:amidohydrolase family protein [Pseudolabrys sp.]
MATHTADTPAEPPYWMAAPSAPQLVFPPGACDAHVHVFGPRRRFPFAEGRGYTPADATKEMLFALHARLGIQHCVIVQPACHGTDNAVTEDAIAASGKSYRGVALVTTDISDAELKRLDDAGLCGARFHYMKHLGKGASIKEVIAFGKRLADFGWHLELHMEAALIADLAPAIHRSPAPVVIDHMGRIDASLGLDQAPLRALRGLLQDRNVWVKVSGADRSTRQGPPYADAVPLARALVEEFSDRVVWGTDWPHPNHQGPTPDDGVLVDLLSDIAPTPALLQALMVDNPQRLYRFAPARRLTPETTP